MARGHGRHYFLVGCTWLFPLLLVDCALALGGDLKKELPERESPARTDRRGDPLPQGAIARCGTIRFRTDYSGFALSPDEKTLVIVTREGLRFSEMPSGKELYSFSFNTKQDAYMGEGGIDLLGFSPNGTKLALRRKHKLVLFDTDCRKPLWEYEGTAHGYPHSVFTADGKILISHDEDGVVREWNVCTGEELRTQPLVKYKDNLLVHSRDGTLVAGRLSVDTFGVWEISTGKTLHTFTTKNHQVGALVFDPTSKTIASLDEDRRHTHLWDLTTGKETVISTKEKTYPVSFVFSPDGKLMATVSDDQSRSFYAWDTATGSELYVISGEDVIRAFAFSPDRKTVALAYDHTIHLLNRTRGETVSTIPFGVHDTDGQTALAFSSNGQQLIVHDGRTIRFWDVTHSREAIELCGHADEVRELAFSGDGKTLVTGNLYDTVCVWEVKSGKALGRFPGPKDDWVGPLQASFDGQIVASATRFGADVYLWDVGSGKQLTRLEQKPSDCFLSGFGDTFMQFLPDVGTLVVSNSRSTEVVFRDTSSGKIQKWLLREGQVKSLAVSHDCKTLAFCEVSLEEKGGTTVGFWDVAKEQLRAIPPLRVSGRILFSPDDKLIAVWEENRISVWEVATGKCVYQFYRAKQIIAVAFTSSGDLVALERAGWPDLGVDLWDVLTSRRLHRFDAEGDLPVAFSPDGTLLATAMSMTDVLIWDVRSHLAKPPKLRLDSKTLDRLWTELAGRDAARGFRAARLLSSSPEAILFLKARLPPAKEERLPVLIANLDANEFDIREAASKELGCRGFGAEPALRAALDKNPSEEVRRRINILLDGMDDRPLTSNLLRESRAIQLLENNGSTDAQHILKSLGQGDPYARLTQDAKRAVERLTK
jgi:WD40 repeat protein